jgi:hypothetical protein
LVLRQVWRRRGVDGARHAEMVQPVEVA